MDNPYAEYYTSQAGKGIPGFSGVRYQRGSGFFNKFFPNIILPLVKYLGKTALSTGYDIARDAAEGTDLRTSLKRRLADTGLNVAEAGIKRARQYAQTGQGRKRKRPKTNKKRRRRRKLPF